MDHARTPKDRSHRPGSYIRSDCPEFSQTTNGVNDRQIAHQLEKNVRTQGSKREGMMKEVARRIDFRGTVVAISYDQADPARKVVRKRQELFHKIKRGHHTGQRLAPAIG